MNGVVVGSGKWQAWPCTTAEENPAVTETEVRMIRIRSCVQKLICTHSPPPPSELLFILTERLIFPSAVNREDMRQAGTLAKKYWYTVLCHWDFGNFVVCVLITNLLSQLSTLQFSLAYFPFMTEPAFAFIICFYNLTSIDPIFIH